MPWNPPGPRCRHCRLRKALPARLSLCYVCCESPDIRALYPSGNKFARRGLAADLHAPPLPTPTTFLPGTPEKVRVMERRVKRGEAAMHPQDARVPPDWTPPHYALKGAVEPSHQETPVPPEPLAPLVREATPQGTKHCPRCDTTKSFDEFAAKRKGVPKLRPQDCHGWCKLCSNAGSRKAQRYGRIRDMTAAQVEKMLGVYENRIAALLRRRDALARGKA
jgi:hypothetical protein